MGNTLTLAVNKIQYQIYEYLKDPQAENHAKQLAIQKAQDKKVAEAKAAAEKNKTEKEIKNAEAKAEAEALALRSKFSSPQVFINKLLSNILSIFASLIIICLALYGGKLEANKAIGYGVPMRIVSFIYGALFFFIVIPKSLYDIYGLNKTIPDYAPLPIWKYVPNGWTEEIFFGPFSYVEDNNSKIAHQEIIHLYSDGFSKSVGLATTVAATVVNLKSSPKSPAPVAAAAAAPVTATAAAPVTPAPLPNLGTKV
jgi:hypothetical protein